MASFSVPPAERAARRVGSVLAGKYTVERVIGTGGMATVYQGAHRNGRRVAIKLLHEELGVHREMRARFVREGYVANAIDHPGAVAVFDDDEADDGAPFLVMELLEGETLADRAAQRGGKLPCREVCALAHQLLSVLAAAHERGVVHRDIKPENLFLTTSCALKVLDFGIARMHDDATGSLATATGMRIGTPAFMPPEQALGRTNEIDARTDLWAVGATMFAMLAGRTVHVAQHAAEVIVISATTPPRPLAEFAPEVPAEVAAVVDRAIRFAAADRWPDARAMQTALEDAFREAYGEVLDPLAVGPKPVPRVVVERTEDERETAAAPLSDGAPRNAGQVPTTRIRENRATPASEPTVRSDRTAPLAPVSPRQAAAPSSRRAKVSSADAHAATQDLGIASQKGDPTLSPATLRPRHSSSAPPRSSPSGSESAPPPASQPVPARDHRRLWPLAAIVSAALAAGGMYAAMRPSGQAPSGQAPSGQAPSGQASTGQGTSTGSSGRAPGASCARNVDCKGPEPAICRKQDGQCVTLTTPWCKVLASPADIEDEATVWVGAMYPQDPADPEYGRLAVNAVDLARRDFMETSGGLPPARPGGPKRPIGVVVCDDSKEPVAVAEHLVKDVRVPMIQGFARSKEVMDLHSSLFLPNGVLALASNTASSLKDAPRNPGEPRLVWRVTSSSDMTAPADIAVFSSYIEPEIRAAGVVAPNEPIRVAMLRVGNPSGTSLAELFMKGLRFNGKSVAENGEQFRSFPIVDNGEQRDAFEPQVLKDLLSFSPHVIVFAGPNDELVVDIEEAWPRAAKFRPRYDKGSADVPPNFTDAFKRYPDLPKRIYATDGTSGGEPLTKFIHHYNELFTPHQTAANSTSAPYDAFYLFAYAAAAIGAEPLTGKALAAAIPRLLPPGEPIDVGPAGIYRAFNLLGAGKNIDLQGSMTNLDFDLETGDASLDIADYCFTAKTATEPVRAVESGLIYSPRTKKLTGTRRCP
ncbi:MAG: protein kinase [Polyangiaceae bacterium]